jgi:hypothetical protein
MRRNVTIIHSNIVVVLFLPRALCNQRDSPRCGEVGTSRDAKRFSQDLAKSQPQAERKQSSSPIPAPPPSHIHPPSLTRLANMLAGRLALQAARSAAPRASIASRAAVRSYATPAAGQPTGKPPIALFGIDGTYATALVCLRIVLQGQLRCRG